MMTNCFRRILILIAVVNFISCAISIKADGEPCNFIDTVNLTNSKKFDNGSYLYDDILIPENYVGTYDYIYDMNYNEKIFVPSHKRGCVCLLKTCIRSCCGRNQTYRNSQCQDISENFTLSTEMLISNELVDAYEHFAFQQVHPCIDMLYLNPESPEEKWLLHKNGSLEINNEIKEHAVCIVLRLNSTSTEYTLNALSCFPEQTVSNKHLFKTYSMMFSLPFMLITVIIYLIIPELRTLHGKLLVCYLIGLLIGYSLLCCMNLYGLTLRPKECTSIGFIAYFCFISSFIWLSVISFDLWWGIRKINVAYRLNERKRFIIYSLFAYGISLLILAFAMVMHFSKDIPNKYKPGFDGETKCFLNIYARIPSFLYLYGLIILTMTTNMILFILTAITIYKVQRELAGVMAVKDNKRTLKYEETKFLLFLRLFIIMGIVWTFEIICFLIEGITYLEGVTYVLDFLNAIHGFVIFVLFVVKGKVKKLFIKRFTKGSSNDSNKSSSTNTSMSMKRLKSTASN